MTLLLRALKAADILNRDEVLRLITQKPAFELKGVNIPAFLNLTKESRGL